MRVLLVSTSVVPVGAMRYGGIEKMCYDLAAGLERAGQNVTIAAPYGSEAPQGVKITPTVFLPKEQDRDDLAVDRVLGSGDDFDVIHDFSHKHRFSEVTRLPAAYMVWDPVERRYFKSHYNICCVSQWQAERFRKRYGQWAEVFPKWGYVGPEYKPMSNPNRERFLFVGKMTPEKGALEAMDLAMQSNTGLDVVGGLIPSDRPNYVNAVRKIVEERPDIKLHFNATEEEKIRLIQNAKAVIYPLMFDEAHNLVAIEAAQCMTPFIQYRRGAIGAQQELAQGLGARVVQSQEEFLQAMKGVDGWFEPAREDWSVDSRVPTYLEFYRRIMDGERW